MIFATGSKYEAINQWQLYTLLRSCIKLFANGSQVYLVADLEAQNLKLVVT